MDLKRIRFELDTKGLKPGKYWVSLSSEVKLPAGNLHDFDSLISSPQYILERDCPLERPRVWVLDLKEADIAKKKIVIDYKPGDDLRGCAKLVNN